MTTEVVFDTWAWWEVFLGERVGARIEAKYLAKGRVATSAWALGELQCKLGDRIPPDLMAELLRRIRGAGPIVDVTPELATEGARLRATLRKASPRASLGDGVMLATARNRGSKLVSGDSAFAGQPDVLRA